MTISTKPQGPLVRLRWRWLRLVPLGVLVAFIVGCPDDDGGCDNCVESVEVAPTTLAFDAFGQTQQLTATARNAAGEAIPEATFTWSTGDATVATVSNGLVASVANGTTVITVGADAHDATCDVTVLQVGSQLAFSTQPVGGLAEELLATQPEVQVQDSEGNLVADDNTTEVTVAIGTNAGGGTLTGTLASTASAGEAAFTDLTIDKHGDGYTLTASATGLTSATSAAFNVELNIGSVEVTPTQLNFSSLTEEGQLTAVAYSPLGAEVTGVPFDWSSDDTGVCSVDGTGLVTAEGNGTAQVSAEAGGQSDFADCDVQQVADEISVAPQFAVLAVGEVAALDVMVLDALDNEIVSPSLTITPRVGGVVTVSGTDLTGATAGVTDVVVTSDALSDSMKAAVVDQSGFAMLGSTSQDAVWFTAGASTTLVLDFWMIRPTGGDGDLGSIQGELVWDPAVLTYVSSEGVESGFTWLPNETNVGTGTLGFGAFSATGSASTFVLGRVTFTVSGSAGEFTDLTLTASAAGDALGTNILPLLQVVSTAVFVE
jgi:hypothetical protein